MKEQIPAALDGERIDRVVALLTGLSRSAVAVLLADGQVVLDGEVVAAKSRRVAEGEVVELEVPPVQTTVLTGDPSVAVPVVHEDPHLLVIDKPAGLVVHPGAGQEGGTLVHGLLARFPELASVGQEDRPGVVHRLDKGTSGLLLVARTEEAYESLVAMLAARQVERRYRALVWGSVEAPAGAVEAPVGRAARDRTRMTITQAGKPALTRYEVVRRFRDPVVTELLCSLATGRTHQIRVHMTSIGHPVVGDARYGGSRPSVLTLERTFLHAEHLGLTHPVTGEALVFSSELPRDLAQLRERLISSSGGAS